MTTILAVDPGNLESGWCLIEADTCKPILFGKDRNDRIREGMITIGNPLAHATHMVIEMVASYGMPVGKEVFETCVWIGHFQAIRMDAHLIYRQPVKLHHCNSPRAKDGNVIQALVDRFASGRPNRGKGTKAAPGWFYGFRADIWQAMALAVYAADKIAAGESL